MMELVWDFYLAHAFWSWIALGAVLLAAEVATGTGNLMWPAGCAALTGVFAGSGFSPGPPAEIGLFAVLTIAAVLVSRRLLKKAVAADGPDVNDQLNTVVGAQGRVVGSLEADRGRVFVKGKEWAALLDGGGRLEDGAAVEVVSCQDSTTLKVRAAGRGASRPG
jgi:membrane protein implicated in regulation of membrane protease activity